MKIKITTNGPYEVSGNIPLFIADIIIDTDKFPIEIANKKKIETDETYYLCRCGNSKNKPFCDGSHIKNKFNGSEVAKKEITDENILFTETKKLKLKDIPELCDHSRFCTRAGGIRKLMEEGDINEESLKIAIDEASLCPSGRLTMFDKNNNPHDNNNLDKEIIILYDTGVEKPGAIWVKGNISVESADSETYTPTPKKTLCRCGKSKNKPFCDGSHWISEKIYKKFRKQWHLE